MTATLEDSALCRLELNNSGCWKLIGRFDAADDDQRALVLDAAEQLVKTLHNNEDSKHCPTMRVSMDGAINDVLVRWRQARNGSLMSLSDKQLAGNQRRTLRAMRKRLLEMADEWDGMDQFNMSHLVELADAAEQVSADMIVQEQGCR